MEITVLIIEDNEKNIYLETYLLKHSGYKVIQARNGLGGVMAAKEFKPDIILLDVQLPVMDGYAVAKELRKDKNISSIPIVAVTSYAMPGDRKKILAIGCDGYMEKPINPDTFVKEIEKYLKK